MSLTTTQKNGRILVVDDEHEVRNLLVSLLSEEGYYVEDAASGADALKLHRENSFDLVISDLKMPDMSGIELLRNIKGISARTMVVIMTAYSTWASAVEAMRLGAYDYVKKPFDNTNVKMSVSRAMEVAQLYDDMADAEADILKMQCLVGNSTVMRDIHRLITRVAPTDATVLIMGESGTGKELVARALHSLSPRSQQPFLPINCGAFTESLLESELFGHVKGSFTGAVTDKKGLFEVADKGTLFLDEVSELSPQTQVKLLRFLEEREVKPVGSTRTMRVDVRVLAATNRDLEQAVTEDKFREDLFYRLNVIPLELAPLRERKDDIPLLAGHFIARHAPAMRKEINGISEDAMAQLKAYHWPGNVRELDNILQRAIALTDAKIIGRDDLVGRLRTSAPGVKLADTEIPAQGMNLVQHLEDIERKYIATALDLTGQNITNAAQLLGMSFRSLRYRIKKLGISRRKP